MKRTKTKGKKRTEPTFTQFDLALMNSETWGVDHISITFSRPFTRDQMIDQLPVVAKELLAEHCCTRRRHTTYSIPGGRE